MARITMRESSTDTPILSDCPLCLLAAAIEASSKSGLAVHCTHCGEFFITKTAQAMIAGLPSRFRIALAAASVSANQSGTVLDITVQNLAQLAAPHLSALTKSGALI